MSRMSKDHPAARAASYFYKLLGCPKEFAESSEAWSSLMLDTIGDIQIEDLNEIKRFLKWAVVENDYSRRYLMVAKDPMVTLKKQSGGLVRRWRVDNPVVDPDPLYETFKVQTDGSPLELKRVRRKPKTVVERKELIAKASGRRFNPHFTPWLAQDKCEKCHGKGGYNAKVNPDFKPKNRVNWQEVYRTPCECVLMEEFL